MWTCESTFDDANIFPGLDCAAVDALASTKEDKRRIAAARTMVAFLVLLFETICSTILRDSWLLYCGETILRMTARDMVKDGSTRTYGVRIPLL